MINFTDSDSENLNLKWGLYLKLVKNEEIKVIEKGALLVENSTSKSYLI